MNQILERIKSFLLLKSKQPTTWIGIIALVLGLIGKDEKCIQHAQDIFTLIFWGAYATTFTNQTPKQP